MIRWLRQRLSDRRALKEAERRAKELAIRRKVLGSDPPMMTPTGVFWIVNRSIDASVEEARKARETAQKILDPKK